MLARSPLTPPRTTPAGCGQTFGLYKVCFSDPGCSLPDNCFDTDLSDPRIPFTDEDALTATRVFMWLTLACGLAVGVLLALVDLRGRLDLVKAVVAAEAALLVAQLLAFVSFLVMVDGATDFSDSFYWFVFTIALTLFQLYSARYRFEGAAPKSAAAPAAEMAGRAPDTA